jgi:hypothetical protein
MFFFDSPNPTYTGRGLGPIHEVLFSAGLSDFVKTLLKRRPEHARR